MGTRFLCEPGVWAPRSAMACGRARLCKGCGKACEDARDVVPGSRASSFSQRTGVGVSSSVLPLPRLLPASSGAKTGTLWANGHGRVGCGRGSDAGLPLGVGPRRPLKAKARLMLLFLFLHTPSIYFFSSPIPFHPFSSSINPPDRLTFLLFYFALHGIGTEALRTFRCAASGECNLVLVLVLGALDLVPFFVVSSLSFSLALSLSCFFFVSSRLLRPRHGGRAPLENAGGDVWRRMHAAGGR